MKRFLILLPVALVASLLYALFLWSTWGQRYESNALDLWANLSESGVPSDEAVVVAMDEQSYGALQLPLNQAWPRALHAKLLRKLAESGAKRVVFDVLFLGEGASKEVDDELARAMALLPVVLGADSILKDYASGSGSFKIEELELAHEPFRKAAETSGLVGFPEDSGYLRRFLSGRSQITREMPSLSEAAAGLSRNGQTQLPGENDFLRYYGPRGTIPTIPYYQVVDTDNPLLAERLKIFKGKTVFVGLVLQTEVGPSQKDVFLTPFGPVFGTEIHATAMLNLLRRDWIKRSSLTLEIFIIGVVAFLGSLVILGLRPLFGLLLTLAAFLAWAIGSYLAYQNNFFLPGISLVKFMFPLMLLVSTMYYYFVTRRSELKMQSAFELYLSPEMAKEVARTQGSIALGGEKIWATALFTDIEGFSSISESMPAERVAAMLNAYFSEVMNAIFENKGTLIKFIGDAVFALWGAPVKINNHAEKACETALSIQRGVELFNNSGRFPALYTRVGIHTGPMVVGNLGSSRRFDYTAIGDSVNLASRIEGINKQFGSRILISETTRKELSNSFHTLQAGSIVVAGKREAVDLHFLLDRDLPKVVQDGWNDALKHFRLKQFDLALSKFAEIKGRESFLDKPISLYEKQIQQFGPLPPPAEWQGELVFSEK